METPVYKIEKLRQNCHSPYLLSISVMISGHAGSPLALPGISSRSSGSGVTAPAAFPDSHPVASSRNSSLTAAGTAQDSHLLPS